MINIALNIIAIKVSLDHDYDGINNMLKYTYAMRILDAQ